VVRVITIHGTNAGAPSNNGDQWWQIDSAFQRRLQLLIQEPLTFHPFHWSGKNSERERRKAGLELSEEIRKAKEAPIIIAHSHGGSVAQHALFYLLLSNPRKFAENIRGLVTVGAPIIRYFRHWNFILGLNIIGQMFLIYAISLLITVGRVAFSPPGYLMPFTR
jgi:hypothetical protein